jgi:hypothetical protein
MIYVYKPGSDEFKKLRNKAFNLGCTKFGVSTKGNYKYFCVYNGRTVHFGYRLMSDFLWHKDEERRQKYRARHSKVLLKDGRPSYKVKGTPAYFSWNLLWD